VRPSSERAASFLASPSKGVRGKGKHIRSDERLIDGLAAPQEELKMNSVAATTHFEHLEGTDLHKSRAYSPAIITAGGKIVWLAGQTAIEDVTGRSIVHDFEAQTRTCFELIGRTLARAGGSLKHLVTMTVYLTDVRHGDRFVEIRKELFSDGKFPCSALLTISGFARPGILIEIQGVAVIPT
jgi:2-iminobutanoate/2-iminopropanoate deaminase